MSIEHIVVFYTLPLRKKLQIFEPNCCSLANRDLPNPSPIFLVRSAFTWHYLWRNQFHSKKYFYISSFLQLFTANFQIYLIILKKWMNFCLWMFCSTIFCVLFTPQAESILNISEACTVDSAGDWVIQWDWVFTNIEFTSQKKRSNSWRNTAYFKIS